MTEDIYPVQYIPVRVPEGPFTDAGALVDNELGIEMLNIHNT